MSILHHTYSKIGAPVYRKLVLTALVTAVAFGGFSALNFYIFTKLAPTPLNHNRVMVNGQYPQKRTITPLANSLFTTAGMLMVWLFNIGILLSVESSYIHTNKRALIRIIGSYAIIIAIIIAYTSLNSYEWFFMKFAAPFPFMTAIIVNTIVIGILELTLLLHHKTQADLELNELRMNHLLARHQQLKHQLHPHFLFNSLNTLKSLIKKCPKKSEEYLMRLSSFLRSSLTMNELYVLPLYDELRLCVDYMEMQKMRFGEAFNYAIEIPPPVTASVSVPAFSIQLLIENAIKHNVLTLQNPLSVNISYKGGYIQVQNNKKLKNSKEPTSAIGLKNLTERYKMISGSDIIVIDKEDKFTVKIQVLEG
jgi:two-component system LytT family sensor kinase